MSNRIDSVCPFSGQIFESHSGLAKICERARLLTEIRQQTVGFKQLTVIRHARHTYDKTTCTTTTRTLCDIFEDTTYSHSTAQHTTIIFWLCAFILAKFTSISIVFNKKKAQKYKQNSTQGWEQKDRLIFWCEILRTTPGSSCRTRSYPSRSS